MEFIAITICVCAAGVALALLLAAHDVCLHIRWAVERIEALKADEDDTWLDDEDDEDEELSEDDPTFIVYGFRPAA